MSESADPAAVSAALAALEAHRLDVGHRRVADLFAQEIPGLGIHLLESVGRVLPLRQIFQRDPSDLRDR